MAALASVRIGEACESCRSNAAAFFSSLSARALDAFECANYTCAYPPGAMLFLEGQESNGIFLVCKGRVKLTMTRADARSIIIRIAEPGELVGLDCVMSRKPFAMTAETLDPCVVHFVRHELLRSLMRDHHELSVAVAEHLSNDYRSACSQIRSLALSRTASEKIVHFLLEWGAKGRETAQGLRVNIPLKHDEIAQIVGVSRETVTRTLTELKHKQLITIKGPAVLILNKSGLEALAVT